MTTSAAGHLIATSSRPSSTCATRTGRRTPGSTWCRPSACSPARTWSPSPPRPPGVLDRAHLRGVRAGYFASIATLPQGRPRGAVFHLLYPCATAIFLIGLIM